MAESFFATSPSNCRELLRARLDEPAPGRIQLLTGPRQIGKTTLLLSLSEELGRRALYTACDSPEASVPGYWERLWTTAEERAQEQGLVCLFLDEVHLLSDWAARLKSAWDRVRRRKLPLHVIATGSCALSLSWG